MKPPIQRGVQKRQPRPSQLVERPARDVAGARLAWFSYPWRRLAIGLALLAVVVVLASGVGSVGIPPMTVIKVLAARLPAVDITPTWSETSDTILWQLRLPRIVLAGIVGGTLALSGATYQGLFRNPLADPYLIGVASGAGLGATIVLVTDVPHSFGGVSLLPAAAFVGAVGAVTVAYVIARSTEGLPLATLILAGVAIASLASSVTALLMIRSDPDLRPVLSWLLGGFISAQWKHSAMILPYLIPSAVVMLAYGRILNVFQLDDEQAQQLGVNVERAKLLLIAAASLATAAAVSFSGLIGFVGLIAPHAVRLMWGVDHRALLPMAAVVGAVFLVLADLVARTAVSPAELPVGIVTAFCGAPFFLYLLRRRGHVSI
jgi:iron complex transport system permease protein